jgi:translation initiation factor 4A
MEEIVETEQIKTISNWDDMNLKEDILRGIYRCGFENPTPIQTMAIIPIINRRDIIAQAQSGTGKTGSFTIGSLQVVNTSEQFTQVIILAPTRELVKQIESVILTVSDVVENIKIYTLVGGTSVVNDSNYLKKNKPHIVIGTTGRIYDMINRKNLQTDKLKLLVMDEADEMLSKGFKEQVHSLFKNFPEKMNIALFSATMPIEVLNITEQFMNNPLKITLKPEELTLECIQQYYVAVRNDTDKYDILKDLFSILEINQSIIYVSSRSRVDELYDAMINDGFPVCCIHSSMEKVKREEALKKFRNGQFRVLISSGITARGIDVQQVSTVINFDITKNVHTYLHAIGRSGRYGRKGLAINFVTKYDINIMKRIEKYYKVNIKELPSNVKDLI